MATSISVIIYIFIFYINSIYSFVFCIISFYIFVFYIYGFYSIFTPSNDFRCFIVDGSASI